MRRPPLDRREEGSAGSARSTHGDETAGFTTALRGSDHQRRAAGRVQLQCGSDQFAQRASGAFEPGGRLGVEQSLRFRDRFGGAEWLEFGG